MTTRRMRARTPTESVAVSAAQRQEAQRVADQQAAAQQSVLDLTRNIQRRIASSRNFSLPAAKLLAKTQTVSKGPKVGRNDLCPCGSGKKYKKCHGAS